MKKNFGKQMRRRCMSIVLASAMVLCTPASDTFAESGIISGMVQKAKAAEESGNTVDTQQKLDNTVVADATLLEYLRSLTAQGDKATIADLQSAEITEIVVPKGVTSLKGLGYVTQMEKLDLSQCDATEIGKSEFNNCGALTEVIMTPKITKLGAQAFNNCSKLEKIDLTKVTEYEDSVFANCSKLNDKSLKTLSNSVSEMGSGVFSGCKAITTAKVPEITGDNKHRVPARMFSDCENLTNVSFCDQSIQSIQEISDQSFAGTGELTFGADKTDVLPDTIRYIGASAFEGSKIVSIDLSKTKVTELKERTFCKAMLYKLNDDGTVVGGIKLPDKLKEIGKEAFEESHLQSIVMPNTVETLGEASFKFAGNLLNVTLSTNITEIPAEAFQRAGTKKFSLNEIKDITNWEDWEKYLDSLEGMQVDFNGKASDSKLETIGGSAFNASTMDDEDFLKDLTKLTTIETWAFAYTDYESLTIPACVTTIGESAFNGMYELTSVVFAKGSKLKEIPKECFGSSQVATNKKTYADLVLEKVQLPESLESIGEDAFGYCWSLNTVGYNDETMKKEGEINFPDTLTTIEKQAFENTGFYKLTKLDEETGERYCDKYCIKMTPRGYTKVTIPDSVTSIGQGAFRFAAQMQEIYFGKGITELPEEVCYGCGHYPYKEGTIQQMEDKDGVVTSDDSGKDTVYKKIPFEGLTKVQLPENVETIGKDAFKECYALQGFVSQSAPKAGSQMNADKLKEIGMDAFRFCKSLEAVTFPSSLETIGDTAFAYTAQEVSEKVISKTTEKQVSYAKQYTFTDEDSKNMTNGLSVLEFQFAKNLKTIGKGAFEHSSISEINFRSDALEEIPASVCEDCYNLTKVTIPAAVKKINDKAFANTYNLQNITVPLSAEWSKNMLAGVAGYNKGSITVVGNPDTKPQSIYYKQDNKLDFNCVNNFKDVKGMTVTVTEEKADQSGEKPADLLKEENKDKSEYITVERLNDASGNYDGISVYGKKMGEQGKPVVRARVSGSIPLSGTKGAENNTTALNDADITLLVSQLYELYVVENPIAVLEFSSDRLLQDARENILYLPYGVTDGVSLKASYQGEDNTKETTDTVEWELKDNKVAKLDGTPVPGSEVSKDDAKIGTSTVKLVALDLGEDTEISLKSSSGELGTCKVAVRIPLERVSLDRRNVGIDVNKTFDLKVNETLYSDANAELLEKEGNSEKGDVYRFTSSDENIVKVDAVTGHAETLAEGNATITVKSLVSGKTDTCTVVVKEGYIPDATDVELSDKELTLFVGDKAAKLTAKINPVEADQTITWSSADEKIATVDSEGNVTPVGAGKVGITATSANGKSAVCQVTVNIHTESVSIGQDTMNMYVGQQYSFKPEVLPDTATDKNLTWTSSDETVVKITGNGNVSALAAGKATVTATTVDGKNAVCEITVMLPAESVALSQTELKLNVGDQTALTATISPADACQDLEWTSSNTNIATVAGGVITAKAAGDTTITVKTVNGKTAACKVTVKIPVASVTLDKTEIQLDAGKSDTLKAEVLPKEATDKKVTWTSSDESIAKVSASGSVTGVKAGTVTITALADGKSAACTVKVNAVAESVVLSAEQLKIVLGGTATLTASVTPAEANQTVEWTSSDPSIAAVENGVVTALKLGTVNITVKSADGKQNAVCRIIVTAPKVKLTTAKNVKKKSVKLKWKKIADVAGYQISYGKKKMLVTTNSAKIKKLKKKKKIAFKVRAYTLVDGKKVFGKWSNVKKVKIKK